MGLSSGLLWTTHVPLTRWRSVALGTSVTRPGFWFLPLLGQATSASQMLSTAEPFSGANRTPVPSEESTKAGAIFLPYRKHQVSRV